MGHGKCGCAYTSYLPKTVPSSRSQHTCQPYRAPRTGYQESEPETDRPSDRSKFWTPDAGVCVGPDYRLKCLFRRWSSPRQMSGFIDINKRTSRVVDSVMVRKAAPPPCLAIRLSAPDVGHHSDAGFDRPHPVLLSPTGRRLRLDLRNAKPRPVRLWVDAGCARVAFQLAPDVPTVATFGSMALPKSSARPRSRTAWRSASRRNLSSWHTSRPRKHSAVAYSAAEKRRRD